MRTGNLRVLESLGLLSGESLVPKKASASKPRGPRELKVWPQSDRVMRDARCLKTPQRLSPGEPGREFSNGASYVPAGIETVHSALPSNGPIMKSKQEILAERRDQAMAALDSEMAKQLIDPTRLLAATREVEIAVGSDAALNAREALRAAVGSLSQATHAELVELLDKHMVEHDIKGTRVHCFLKVSATTFYIWRGRTAQNITARLSAAVDEAVACYLAGVAMGIDEARKESVHGPAQEPQCPSDAVDKIPFAESGVATSRAASVRPGYGAEAANDVATSALPPMPTWSGDGATAVRGKWQRVRSTPKAVTWQHADYPDLDVVIPHTVSDGARRVRLCRELERYVQDLDCPMRKRLCTAMEKLHEVKIMVAGEVMEVTSGMAVEVQQVEEGLVGSSYEATVIELRRMKGDTLMPEALVEYKTLFDEEAPPCEVATDEDQPDALVWNVPGQCGTPGCLLPDFHCEPCTPLRAINGPRVHASAGGTEQAPSAMKLREWVKVSSLMKTREKPPRDWHKALRPGDEAEMLHDDGFWRVIVIECLPNDHSKKGHRFTVRVSGYGIEHTVSANVLRPRAVH